MSDTTDAPGVFPDTAESCQAKPFVRPECIFQYCPHPEHCAAQCASVRPAEADKEKPAITAKELSWHEAVAAHRAWKESEQQSGAAARLTSELLGLPLHPRVRCGGMELEPYHFAMSLVLEALQFPLETGGRTDRAEIILALIVFRDRAFAERLVREKGREKARALLLSPEAQGEVLTLITPAQFGEFADFLRAQYGLEGNSQAATTTRTAAPMTASGA